MQPQFTRRMVCGSILALAACEAPAAGSLPPLRMSAARAAHMAKVLSDGSVLFIGGCVADGCRMGPASADVDRFDPRRGVVERVGRLHTPRNSSATVLLPDDRILIAGGWSGPEVTRSIELFDPRTGSSQRVGELAEAREGVEAALLADGRVLLAGGDIAEIFHVANGEVEQVVPLAARQLAPAITPLKDGRILLAGGGVRGDDVLATAQIFDPAARRFRLTAPLAEPRRKHAAVALADGRALVVGGSGLDDRRNKIRRIEIFDPARERFDAAGNLLELRYKIPDAAVRLGDGRVLIAGGADRPEVYDPATERSHLLDFSFDAPLNFASAMLLPNGDVMVAGGYDERTIQPTDRVWVIPRQMLARPAVREAEAI